MRLVFMVVSVALLLSLSIASSLGSSPDPLQRRVTKLEKQVKLEKGQIASLTVGATQMEMNFENAAQAESNLEARVTKLEQVVFKNGNP